MIIKTKIDWLQTKNLSEEEKKLLEAKKSVVDDYNEYEEEYEEAQKDAIIDTLNDKVYIEVEDNKICLIRLLEGMYFPTGEGSVERVEERMFFESNIQDIYEQLIEENNKNK